MRVPLVACAVLLVSGCLAGDTPDAHPAEDTATPSPFSAPAEPGFFAASPEEGLVPIESIPGLTATVEGRTTRYDLDATQLIVENWDPLFLIQVFEAGTARLSYDVDVRYVPPLQPGSDYEAPDAVCLGTALVADESEHGFYLARALGGDAPPPAVLPGQGFPGWGVGHARAGPTSEVIRVFGERFAESDQVTAPILAGQFIRVSNFLSQLDVRTVQMPGNHWWQNITVEGPHRVILLPPAPFYCASGFGEFTDATIVGRPPFETTIGGYLEMATLYGSSLLVGSEHYPPDPNPGNVLRASFLDIECVAGGGRNISISRFDAGTVRLELDRWVGHPFMTVHGMGPGQEMFGQLGAESCQR